MLRVTVAGFPRTATTRLYKEIGNTLRVLRIFEPFNGEVVHQILIRKEEHYHDREGLIEHDYFRLPEHLRFMLQENSSWIFDWVSYEKPSTVFLGGWFWNILYHLDRLEEPVLVKDVYAWVKLKDLIEAFPRCRFVVTVRDMESIYRSLCRWYENRRTRAYKYILRKLPRIYKLFLPGGLHRLKEAKAKIEHELKPLQSSNMLGIGLFYRYFNGGVPEGRPSKKLLREMLQDVYARYLGIVGAIEGHDNILVVKFHGKLPREKIKEIIAWVKEQ